MLPTAKREDGRKDFGDYKLAPIIQANVMYHDIAKVVQKIILSKTTKTTMWQLLNFILKSNSSRKMMLWRFVICGDDDDDGVPKWGAVKILAITN